MSKRFVQKPERGFLERLMFHFMGPPQVGENKAPEGYVPDKCARNGSINRARRTDAYGSPSVPHCGRGR